MAPHLKALFQGLDVTIFAYGVTGTGKTHTMRGGLKLAERGVIPRLLSNVFRRGKKIAKDSDGETTVSVTLSYYEIYNDKVFDLLEAPETRTPSGLRLSEKDGKTIVMGLSERACMDLKDFEQLYIEANNNRVTAATKLNAHSSRSHAILRVKVTQTTGDMVRESTVSAIDLAGSEDNRRTDNDKTRLVESAAINKSLFVLSQCINAISNGDKRIPYRESKMTRILSLGQNNGITIMILNLAPMRSYHLDTLSSLNVSSRAKRIEVREIENEVVFKMAPPPSRSISNLSGTRQALRPLANAHNVTTGLAAAKEKAAEKEKDKPVKAFSVYKEPSNKPLIGSITTSANITAPRRISSMSAPLAKKRPSDGMVLATDARPSKLARPTTHVALSSRPTPQPAGLTPEQIEEMIERKVAERLAALSAATAPAPPATESDHSHSKDISEEVSRRLEALERRIDGEQDARSDGLRLLLQARQAKQRGDDQAALEFYESALPYFPGQAKLLGKIERLKAKLSGVSEPVVGARPVKRVLKKREPEPSDDESYHEADADEEDEGYMSRPRKAAARRPLKQKVFVDEEEQGPPTPRTEQLLAVVNSRDIGQIKALHGVGAKKARDLVEFLEDEGREIQSLGQLRMVPGMGGRAVERALEGMIA